LEGSRTRLERRSERPDHDHASWDHEAWQAAFAEIGEDELFESRLIEM
jgi:hypothetical protein